MAVVFNDDFNRADGDLGVAVSGQSWWSLNNSVQIAGGKAVPTSGNDNYATADAGAADMTLQASVEPNIFVAFRAIHGLGLHEGGGCLAAGVEGGNLLFLRWGGNWQVEENIALGHSGPYGLEVVADGPNVTIKVDGTTHISKQVTDFQDETGVGMYMWATGAGAVDSLTVDGEATTTTTSTTTETPTTTTTTTTTVLPPLPETLTPGVSTGHLAHHNRLHDERGSMPQVEAGQTGHLEHHGQLKSWYDLAHPGTPLTEVIDGDSHAQAHESLHVWVNEPPPVGEGIQPGATSLLFPNYLNSGSVMQRDVRDMPLASNSSGIAANLRAQQVATGYYTGLSAFAYNFPSYAIDASQIPMATVTWRNLRQWDWTPEDVMEASFGQKPIPEYAVPAAGTDAALVVYDTVTDTMWEWWQMIKTGPYQWAAEWGSRTLNANNNYANRSDVGSLSASGLNGVLGQIGIGEVRDGWIDHALIFACTGSGIGWSWPAKQSDGSSADPNAPLQGQWGRLPASVNVEAFDNELLRMVGRAAQRYGIVPVDFAGSVSFCGESGAHEKAATGTDPWSGLLANEGGGKADWEVLHGFPWEATEWAPVDWGKP